ncbi:Ubiquitin-conjugating enzyme e2 [Thalictrum thalictroides]|uniref:Ubiquitin-conjugating enzyme e2 n=1 Tax=Thalictrum thalictroides TaxID=46969 RepID=A0A7J6UW57_THATH|nr:Ubiquitin-conjugating enzyme e2 [Thalictrum thalictroides]
MAEEKYNMKNPAVKRILQEVKEMQSNPSDDFMSLPLEENIFEWQFAIAGPRDSEFEGGIYHGRIQLPAEYPFKPPSFMLLTENIFEWQFAIAGPRDSEFEGGIYHGRIQLPAEYPFKPPSFMLLTPNGRFETQTKICLSISNYHPEHWQPSWSVRTALVALIAFMPTNPNGALGSLDYKKEERRKLAVKSREAAPTFGSSERQKLMDEPNPEADDRIVADVREVHVNANAGPLRVSFSAELSVSKHVPAIGPSEQVQVQEVRVLQRSDDRLFTWAAVGLTLAIVVLLLKKFLRSSGVDVASIGGFK